MTECAFILSLLCPFQLYMDPLLYFYVLSSLFRTAPNVPMNVTVSPLSVDDS